MKYYVIYQNRTDHMVNVMDCILTSTVEEFIETKINEQEYDPRDFKVMEGTELSIKVTPAKARVMLKTEVS